MEPLMYFERPVGAHSTNLKIINREGKVLSLDADDSCGELPRLSRFYLSKFKDVTLQDEEFSMTHGSSDPENFLRYLADHLGYEVTKKRTITLASHVTAMINKYHENRVDVILHHNNETGAWYWSVCVADQPDFWLNAFKDKNQALEYCEKTGHKITKEIDDEKGNKS